VMERQENNGERLRASYLSRELGTVVRSLRPKT
jgi:hypothetical protein